MRCCARCWPAAWRTASASSATSAPPTRAARRGASRAGARTGPASSAHRGGRRRRPVRPPSSALLLRASSAQHSTDARSSAPTPTSAPSRSPMRCAPAPQIVVGGRVADPSLTVGPALAHFGWRATTGTGWPRHDGRPPARMRRPGHRRLLRRPRLQGRARPGAARLSDRRDRRRRRLHDHQGRGHRRRRRSSTRSRSSCSTRCTTRRPTSRPTWSPTSRRREVEELGADRVRLTGVRGHRAPGTLKVNVCYESGWLAEGEISYAGPRAEARARLAADVLRERLADVGAAARRPDRREQPVRRRRRPLARAPASAATRATCACAWRCDTPTARRPSGWRAK